jgi:hypothetical protein
MFLPKRKRVNNRNESLIIRKKNEFGPFQFLVRLRGSELDDVITI